jgi:NADPH2:quinone reductase
MRAAVFNEPGPASSVLQIVERDLPLAGAGEVRVRIVLSAVNPTDTGTRAGRGVPDGVAPPRVPNQDGAGVVDAVGEGVQDLEPGDRVWVWDAGYARANGTAQEYVVLPRRQVVRMNDGVPFEVGAALGIPALTAHRCLTLAADGPARLAPGALDGRTVLVAGGAGAVGNAAIQLAKWAGATVITTVSSEEKGVLARATGADHVVNYRTEDTAARVLDLAPDGIDIAVEVAPAQNIALDLQVVRPHGLVSIYANNGGDEMTMPLRAAFGKNLRFQFLILYTLHDHLVAAATEDVTAALEAGALRVGEDAGLPLHHYPLADAAAAHDAVEGGAVGKVLLDIPG